MNAKKAIFDSTFILKIMVIKSGIIKNHLKSKSKHTSEKKCDCVCDETIQSI